MKVPATCRAPTMIRARTAMKLPTVTSAATSRASAAGLSGSGGRLAATTGWTTRVSAKAKISRTRTVT